MSDSVVTQFHHKKCYRSHIVGNDNKVFPIFLYFAVNLTKVKGSMEALVAKKRNESQMLLKKTSPFPPSPVIIWVQQGTDTMFSSSAKEEQML